MQTCWAYPAGRPDYSGDSGPGKQARWTCWPVGPWACRITARRRRPSFPAIVLSGALRNPRRSHERIGHEQPSSQKCKKKANATRDEEGQASAFDKEKDGPESTIAKKRAQAAQLQSSLAKIEIMVYSHKNKTNCPCGNADTHAFGLKLQRTCR